MPRLEELRLKLSQTDQKLLNLFFERMEIIDQVADCKGMKNAKVYVPAQETRILDSLWAQSCPEYMSYSVIFMRTLIRLSRERQYEHLMDPTCFKLPTELQDSTISNIVVLADLTSEYRRKLQGLYVDVALTFVSDLTKAFNQVSTGLVDLAILPADAQVYLLLSDYNLFIRGSLYLSGQLYLKIGSDPSIPHDAGRVSLLVHGSPQESEKGTLAIDTLPLVVNILTDLSLVIKQIQTLNDFSFYVEFLAEAQSLSARRALYQIEQETGGMSLLGWYV